MQMFGAFAGFFSGLIVQCLSVCVSAWLWSLAVCFVARVIITIVSTHEAHVWHVFDEADDGTGVVLRT